MLGLYLHIPFCRKACRYCDFHFSVSVSQKPDIIKAIGIELVNRLKETEFNSISTIYFGGGTPSVLEFKELEFLVGLITSFKISDDVEISFEANPDDLNKEYTRKLLSIGINRLSIGIQSFSDYYLKLLGRVHTAQQSINAIENAIEGGFNNINTDLIYGLPGMSADMLERDIRILTGYEITHISAYHLTYEPGTIFDHWRKKGRIFPVDEDDSYRQFILLRSMLAECGFEHYEISNFARSGFISRHNSNYWKLVPYIGVGPSAHSYNGSIRRWNISSNKKYVDKILQGEKYFEEEELNIKDMFNEYIMTSLRTKWGIIPDDIKKNFGADMKVHVENKTRKYIKDGLLKRSNDAYILTERGIFLSDYIISDLFI